MFIVFASIIKSSLKDVKRRQLHFQDKVKHFANWVILHAFCCLLIFFKIFFFQRFLSGIPSEGQTVWSSKICGLIWVQTVHKKLSADDTTDKRVLKEFASSVFAIIPFPLHKILSVSQLKMCCIMQVLQKA